MSKTVYKYPIPVEGEFELGLPQGARVLSVQVQAGMVCLWALVDPKAPLAPRRFRLAGTGHPIENAESLSFVDTFQLHGGALVFHVFEYVEEGQ